MPRPDITVLMTVYNGGPYLRAAVESVLGQTFGDFEFLIINDNSMDDSLDIILSFHDPRIIVHTNSQNLGQTKSLNEGLRRARGKYVARLDADDLAFSHWLEYQLNHLRERSQCAVLSAKAVVIDRDNRPVKVLKTPLADEDIIMKSLIGSPINHVGSLFRKEIILGVGGYDENFKIAADFDLWSKLMRAGYRLASVPDILVAVRVHEKSASLLEKGKSDFKEVTQIIKKNMESLTTCPPDEEQTSLLWRLFYDVGSLNDRQFQRADGIFQECCLNFKSSLNITSFGAKRFLQDRRFVYYVKRILERTREKDMHESQRLCREYMRREGYLNGMLMIFLFSCLGAKCLRLVFEAYRWLTTVSSNIKLRRAFGAGRCDIRESFFTTGVKQHAS